jgi:hypothetical protein
MSTRITSARKLAALPAADLGLLAEAAFRLAYARLRLPFLAFAALPVESRVADPSPDQLTAARALAQAVAVAGRHSPLGSTCFHQSLALWWMLKARGIAGELRIGIRREEGPFAAHAWVQCAGVALNETLDVAERYRAFTKAVVPRGFRLPQRGAAN